MKSAEIFAAMLEGSYSEAGLAEIPMPQSSAFGLKILIHHLHQCTVLNCRTIKELQELPLTPESAEAVISVANEADKYLLPCLSETVHQLLLGLYLIPESASLVFRFAVLHRKDELMKAAVTCIFAKSKDVHETAKYALELLQSKYADIFLQILMDILTDCTLQNQDRGSVPLALPRCYFYPTRFKNLPTYQDHVHCGVK